jgi:hypothetical protein
MAVFLLVIILKRLIQTIKKFFDFIINILPVMRA